MINTALARAILCSLVTNFALGCSSRHAGVDPIAASQPKQTPAAGSAPATTPAVSPEPTEWFELGTAGGTYTVRISPPPTQFPVNELFGLRVEVLGADKRRLAADEVDLVVDAAMPAHRHGMNVRPKVARGGDGTFSVRGMRLHMSGEWEMYFDVTRGGLTERATLPVTLP
jgi:hypothetical protein